MLRLTIPAPEKSLGTSAVERRGSNGPAPRPCISMGAKATRTRRSITPTTIQLIHRQRQEDERLWRLPQQKTIFLFGRNPRWRRSRWSLGGTLAKKDNWIWSIPVGAVAVPLLDVRSMAAEPLASAHKELVRKTSHSCANQCPADSPRCNKQRSPQGQPQPQKLGVGPANRD